MKTVALVEYYKGEKNMTCVSFLKARRTLQVDHGRKRYIEL